jgi:hypothetical protein
MRYAAPIACCLVITLAADAQVFFRHSRQLPVGPNPCAIAAQDLDDDGWPEIITADRGQLTEPREERPANDELSLLKAVGKLDYTKHHPSLKTGFAPYAIAIANIDALKWPDIVVANFHAVRKRNISLFLNLKHENLFTANEFRVSDDGLPYVRHRDGDNVPLFTSPGLTALAIAEVNGDDTRDLFATAWSIDQLVFMPGDKELFFGEPKLTPVSGGPRDLVLTDLNDDGYKDLAIVCYVTGEVALFAGDAKGAMESQGRFQSRGRLPISIVHGDFNRDGRTDLAVAHAYMDDSVVIFYNDGDFEFSLSHQINLGDSAEVLEHELRDLAAADFNADGRTDLAVTCHLSQQVAVLINEDKGGTPSYRTETYSFDEGKPYALTAADFDQNGRMDLAVTLWETNTVQLLLSRE